MTTAIEEGERGQFSDAKPPKPAGQKLMLLAIIVVALILVGVGVAKMTNWFGIGSAKKAPPPTEEVQRPTSTPGFDVPLAEPKQELEFIECDGGLKLPKGLDCPAPVGTPQAVAEAPPGPPAPPAGPTEEELLQKRRFESEIDVTGKDAGKGPTAVAGGASGLAPAGGMTAMSTQLVGTATAKTRATVNRVPSFTLAKGTLPDCTLVTAISTDQPGFLKCILSRPVYSMDGKVILMEAGTTFEGEYQAGLAKGKKRMFALWTRAITPQHVEVMLNSPSTDALGRSGMTGQIDKHFLERFGGAMMYSLFSDATDYYTKRADQRSQERRAAINAANGGNETSVTVANLGANDLTRSRSTGEQIVEALLKDGEEIQPTLYKHQGEVIKIYVARDVDFSQVYELASNPRD